MKRACGLFLMASMAGCLGGSGGSDFGSDGNNGDGDMDADADGDVQRDYPAAPYWVPGDAPGGILEDMSFQGSGADATVSFNEAFQAWPTTKVLVVIGICAT